MFIIMGGTGHVGSAMAQTLIEQGHAVTVVTHNPGRTADLEALGARAAIADLHDPGVLRDVFQTGRRAFLLNPPADPATDTDRAEQETARLILEALKGSGLEKVVAQSTYGAQPGECLGDLNTLHDLEAGLKAQSVPFTILRAAYYFSNWDALVEPVRTSGRLPAMFPVDLDLPMVSPADLGRVAAGLLAGPIDRTGIVYVEGPQRYSVKDVAEAFAKTFARPVEPVVTPRDGWEADFKALGFSDAAARSYARMTAITADGDYAKPENPIRGRITLQAHIDALAKTSVQA